MQRLRLRLIMLLVVVCTILLVSTTALAAPVLLRAGDRGEIVRVLQELLKAQGLFTVVPDGNFGPHTEEGVRCFQSRAGLKVDAVVGPATWEAFMSRPYIVCHDDTFAALAQRFGTTVEAWQGANPNVKPDSLQVGMQLKMPALPIRAPEQPSRGGGRGSSGRGRLVNWSEANRGFANRSIAQITDVDTGLTFRVRRRGGSKHADVEPVTAADTKVLRQLYPSWSWVRRAVVVDYGSGPVAASINGMPHGGSDVSGNNFPGHMCLHFVGSRTHGSGRVDPDHQAMIRKAAGL